MKAAPVPSLLQWLLPALHHCLRRQHLLLAWALAAVAASCWCCWCIHPYLHLLLASVACDRVSVLVWLQRRALQQLLHCYGP
jgi:hypothetical protein